MISVLQSLSKYNSWANAKIYQAAAELTLEDYTLKRLSSLESIEAALKHLYLENQKWVGKVDGNYNYDTWNKNNLPNNLVELGRLQHRVDLRLLDITKNLSSIDMSRTVAYSDVNLVPFHLPLPIVMTNIFVLQIDYRAKILELLKQAGARDININYLIFVNDTDSGIK